MLDEFLTGFNSVRHLKKFKFNLVLSEDGKVGNLLGEFILSTGAEYKDSPAELSPILTPFFVEAIFDYPYDNWEKIIESHPDYDCDHICEHIRQEKLVVCSKLWISRGFIIPAPGANDTLKTQVNNVRILLNMTSNERKRLITLTQRALFLSGMFGKRIPVEIN